MIWLWIIGAVAAAVIIRCFFGASGGDSRHGTDGMSRDEALDILALRDPVDRAAIRQAYRRMMKHVHPDQGGSEALSILVRRAYERLKDAES